MKKVTLVPLFHRNEWQIGIKFPFDQEIKTRLQKLDVVKWTRTHSCFYSLYTPDNKQLLYNKLREGKIFVDYSELQNFKVPAKETKQSRPVLEFSPAQKKIMHEYVNYLRGQRLSESSVRTYYSFVLKFVHYVGDRQVSELRKRDIELFVEQHIAAENYALSTHRQCISALKHFLQLYDSEHIDVNEIKRPSKSRYLPVVLSNQEIMKLLQATRNLKHRAILAMIYSGGLRIGELLNLKLAHIDIHRRQIFVKNSKGRKDRMVVLAESMLPLLKNYLSTYVPRVFFAEGLYGGAYSPQSIRTFLADSCRRAGIKKRVTPHTLRHSYATHMLENGVDIRYIQELLGHSKPETTMIYTHVSRKDILKIESPLDVMVKQIYKSDIEEDHLLLPPQHIADKQLY